MHRAVGLNPKHWQKPGVWYFTLIKIIPELKISKIRNSRSFSEANRQDGKLKVNLAT